MKRLTNKKAADAQRREYENRLKNGYPRNIPEERFLKLAAYEDTGLEPEQIGKAMEDCADTVSKAQFVISEINEMGDIDHIRDLVRAEKEERLVVLPCKNNTVYTIEEDYFNCAECRYWSRARYQAKIDKVSCDMDNGEHCPFYIKEREVEGFEISFDITGKSVLSAPGNFGYEGLEQFYGVDGKVYYTREEAEAALKKREEKQ